MKDPVTGYGRDPVHGHATAMTPTYKSWAAMIRRCLDPKAVQFPYYGGRGIRIDARWLVFENFLADMGVRPDGMTLSRKDNDGNYEKSNCEWTDRKEQARNRRNVHWLEFEGERMTLADFARRIGIVRSALYNRVSEGWTIERIVRHYADAANWQRCRRVDH